MLSKNPMVNAIQAAQKAARKAIEATYFGSMSVTEQRKVKNGESKLTKTELVMVLGDQPCKLSFEMVKVAAASDTAASVTQVTKLFVSPGYFHQAGFEDYGDTGWHYGRLHAQRCPSQISDASGNHVGIV